MTKKYYAFIFPGQGSQSVGMGKELANNFPVIRETFQEADEILQYSLSKIAWEGPATELNDTANTQPALLVHSVAVLRLLEKQVTRLNPRLLAGHSMGEISALVAANALSFESALRLVRARGLLMKQAGENTPGGMAAIIGLDIHTLEEICSKASTGTETVQIANDNCPGQVVISGSNKALEKAMDSAKAAGAKKVIRLAVSIPAHSRLMQTAASEFSEAVGQAGLADPLIPVVGNVAACPMKTAQRIKADLQAQLTSRVRWTESIRVMGSFSIETFIEIGNGNVLTGLTKRINRHYGRYSTNTASEIEQVISLLNEE